MGEKIFGIRKLSETVEQKIPKNKEGNINDTQIDLNKRSRVTNSSLIYKGQLSPEELQSRIGDIRSAIDAMPEDADQSGKKNISSEYNESLPLGVLEKEGIDSFRKQIINEVLSELDVQNMKFSKVEGYIHKQIDSFIKKVNKENGYAKKSKSINTGEMSTQVEDLPFFFDKETEKGSKKFLCNIRFEDGAGYSCTDLKMMS